ncbi:hypothetical protein [Actinophytocola glycyrrhizae]|uniref:Uncharacterized protein n=1 Tax=Actinophytocola glycyrrhizae TaxID=2044873 RepID=A0ABV9S426_9PSEU
MRTQDNWQPARLTDATTTTAVCPRMYWRLMNPSLPPPDTLTCLTRGPGCCAASATADVRRAA